MEDYHIQVQGERRGPYTLRQIDHMLNASLIPSDALYLREGMEDWQPVTDLVVLREPVNHWRRRAILGGVLLFVLLIARFLGPTVVESWREMSQKDFTERAAYWSARDAVRRQWLPKGELVHFEKFADAQVTLRPEPASASVELEGELIGKDGKTRKSAWHVEFLYERLQKQWTPTGVAEKK